MFLHMGVFIYHIKQKNRLLSIAITLILTIEVYAVLEQALEMFKAGAIIEHEPMAGFKVKENRKIYLILNPMDYKKIPFPDVIRRTFRQAKPSLESLGFKIGDTIYKDDLGKNEVIEVRFKNKKIFPSDLIRKTSVIDIVLGNGKLSSDSE